MKLRTSMTTRGGRKVPRHLYIQRGPEPDDSDPPIGMVDTPAIAALIVAAVAAYIEQDPQRAVPLTEYAGPVSVPGALLSIPVATMCGRCGGALRPSGEHRLGGAMFTCAGCGTTVTPANV